MLEDTRSERVVTCLCLDEESSEQLTLLAEPVELDDADLDAVVGGVGCCGAACSASASRSVGSACCSA